MATKLCDWLFFQGFEQEEYPGCHSVVQSGAGPASVVAASDNDLEGLKCSNKWASSNLVTGQIKFGDRSNSVGKTTFDTLLSNVM
jgi:methylase of polypeptide subunit release factors